MKELKTKKSAEGARVKEKSDALPRAAKRMLRAGLMERQASRQRDTQEKAPERAAEEQVERAALRGGEMAADAGRAVFRQAVPLRAEPVSYTHLDVYKRQVVEGDAADFTVSANGTYDFIITDNGGNTATLHAEVGNVDAARPTVDFHFEPLDGGCLLYTSCGRWASHWHCGSPRRWPMRFPAAHPCPGCSPVSPSA